ncbi:hypothetical protein Tco_0326350, partial [Tanacetum coccineum]
MGRMIAQAVIRMVLRKDYLVWLMIPCPDMDNGEVSVAGMGIHKADGQNDIPNANDNTVNQGICDSANDPGS